jgi:hypothetical protein
VPDLRGYAAANDLIGQTDDEVHAELGDKFPKANLPLDRLHRCAGRFVISHDHFSPRNYVNGAD